MPARTPVVLGRAGPIARIGALMVAGVLVPAAGAQQSFRGLGDLPGGQNYSEVWGVSADGRVVVGDSIISGNVIFGGTYAAFRWDFETGQLQDIYDLGGIGTVCRAYAVNADGSVVVGMADYGVLTPTQITAFIWTSEQGTVEIGDLPGGPSGSSRAAARGVSNSGMILAGRGESDLGAEPFRYTRSDSTFLGCGDLPGGTFGGSGYGISADGNTIVGSSIAADGTHAFRWTLAEGMVDIGHLPVPPGIDPFAEAYAASANGSVIIGLSRSLASSNSGWEAFRWTAATGMIGLGDLPGGAVLSEAYAMTADGSVIVGKAGVAGFCGPFGCQTAPHAFIWDADHGVRDLNAVLPEMGLNTAGWTLSEARGLSADGRIMVGTGINPSGETEAWRADLGVPLAPTCGSADFNCDGDIGTDADISSFFACLSGSCPPAPCTNSADFNNDGDVGTDADIESFFRVLSGGPC